MYKPADDLILRAVATLLLLVSQAIPAEECLDVSPASLGDCLQDSGWEQTHQADGISIYSRRTPDSNVREVLAAVLIRASSRTVESILTGFEQYTDFMPETLERCELLHRESDSYWVFQQLNLPFVSDRFYTIRLQSTHSAQTPERFRLSWSLAKETEYRRRGHGEEVKMNNGSWLLMGQPDGTTLLRYQVHTDPGHLWGWVVNFANSVAVPDLVKAVKHRAESVSLPSRDPSPPGG